MDRQEILSLLNAPTARQRLNNLAALLAQEKEPPQVRPQYANNHIHTFYSFSPYSPTAAVWFARAEGLQTAGIMDHDSIAGAAEFRQAGKLAGVGTTCGLELRVSFEETPLAGRRLNNPDQDGIAYMAVHSVPPAQYGAVQSALRPYREARNRRNRQMTEKINQLLSPAGLSIDFDQDVLPASRWAEGGSVTERHLMWAVAQKILAAAGADGAAAFLEEKLGISLSPKQKGLLREKAHLPYDILGILKAHMIAPIYVPAREECMPLSTLVNLCAGWGAYLCYAYLGDVGDSVTGDKKPETFEDSFLDQLFSVLDQAGVRFVTYMPSRNTDAQIRRLRALCREYRMGEISGEDVNSPRQSFLCSKLADPGFHHLVDAAWDLVRREAQ